MGNYPSNVVKVEKNDSGFIYKMGLGKYYAFNDPVYLHVKMDVFQSDRKNNCEMHLQIQDDSTLYLKNKILLREYLYRKENREEFSFYRYVPPLHSERDYLKIFFTNKGSPVYLDNLELDIYVMKR